MTSSNRAKTSIHRQPLLLLTLSLLALSFSWGEEISIDKSYVKSITPIEKSDKYIVIYKYELSKVSNEIQNQLLQDTTITYVPDKVKGYGWIEIRRVIPSQDKEQAKELSKKYMGIVTKDVIQVIKNAYKNSR